MENYADQATLTIGNSLFSGNTAGITAPNVGNTVNNDNGYNLVDNIAGSAGFNKPTDILHASVALGPLGDNGGPTETVPLSIGSTAVNAGGGTIMITPTAVSSSMASTDLYPAANLLSAAGLSAVPTASNYASVAQVSPSAATNWASKQTNGAGDYFDGIPPCPTLFFTMPRTVALTDMIVWGYPHADEAKTFEVSFSTDGGLTYGNTIVVSHFKSGGNSERLPFGGVYQANMVRVTVTDNFFGSEVGGDRVGLDEVRFMSIPYAADQRGEGYVDGMPDIGAYEAQSRRLVVDTLSDAVNPGDGVTSLREAVVAANQDILADSITFAPSLTGTITLTGGVMSVNNPVTIDGPGSGTLAVSGNDISGIFKIEDGLGSLMNVSVSGLALIHGAADGGAINAKENVSMDDILFSHNSGINGGAVWNSFGGKLTITNSTFASNTSSQSGGAIYTDGGSVTEVRNTLFTGNTATHGKGGAVFIRGATATLTDDTFSLNTAGVNGGAIYSDSSVRIDQSSLSQNSAAGDGGAIFIDGTSANTHGSLVLSKSAVFDNHSATGSGGGVFGAPFAEIDSVNTTIANNSAALAGGSMYSGTSGSLTLVNNTIAGNSAQTGGGISAGGTLDIGNTIIANNTGASPDVDGAVTTDYGSNIVKNVTGSSGFIKASNKLNTDPLLGSFGDHGGPTETIPILAGSPALNAASALVLENPDFITPVAVTSLTEDADFYKAVHLIDGSGLSNVSNQAIHADTNSTNSWVTESSGNPDWYATSKPNPVLTFQFDALYDFTDVVLWGYGGNPANRNEAKTIQTQFSIDGGVTWSDPVTVNHALTGSGEPDHIPLGDTHKANAVRFTITDNHYIGDNPYTGGDRVGLGEVRFVGTPVIDQRGLAGEGAKDIGVFEAHVPKSISLSNSSLPENAGADAVIGELSSGNADPHATATYSLPDGVADNALFNIAGNQLRAGASLNHEAQATRQVTVRVTDAFGNTHDRAFTITVDPANDAPVANDGSVTTNLETVLNGQVSATDEEGDTPSYSLVANPSHGSLVFNSDGSFTYMSAPNYHGPDSFMFKANDGAVDSNIATVHVGVLPATPLTSSVQALPEFSPATVTISWTAPAEVAAELRYSIYVSDNGGSFQPLVTATAQTSASFTGEDGHSYDFYSVVTDGFSTQATPGLAHATTKIDAAAPSSIVSAMAGLSPEVFTVNWSGQDTGSGIATYDIYASDNGGTFTIWQTNTTLTSGVYSGTLGHTYAFYSVAKDQIGNTEAAPATPDAFTFVAPSIIQGTLFRDVDSDGIRDPGEPGLAAAEAFLDLDGDQGPDANEPRTTTDAQGAYAFDDLSAGTYTVVPLPAAGWKTTSMKTVTAGVGETIAGADVGAAKLASVAGWVFEDSNNNGERDPAEPGVAGATVKLTGTVAGKAISPRTAVTGQNGRFGFDGLAAGKYQLSETQPAGFFDGQEQLGNGGGTKAADRFMNIPLGEVTFADGYNFGERRPLALDDAFAVAPGKKLSGSVLTNDVKGTVKVVPTRDTLPTRGTVELKANGTFVYTANADSNGRDFFTYKLVGPNGVESAPARVDLTTHLVAFKATAVRIPEKAGTYAVTVALNTKATSTMTVNYTVTSLTASSAGVDYTLAAGLLTFNPDDLTKTILVSVANDLLDEIDETLQVALTETTGPLAVGKNRTATLTIADDDAAPKVSFREKSSAGGEDDSPNFEVLLNALSGRTVTVAYAAKSGTAKSGSDYAPVTGTLTFAPGETSKLIPLPVVNDLLDEPDETVIIVLSKPVNAIASGVMTHTHTILANDPARTVSFEGNTGAVVESGKTFAFAVVLSSPAAFPVSVKYALDPVGTTAIVGKDFTLPAGTVTFKPGKHGKRSRSASPRTRSTNRMNRWSSGFLLR